MIKLNFTLQGSDKDKKMMSNHNQLYLAGLSVIFILIMVSCGSDVENIESQINTTGTRKQSTWVNYYGEGYSYDSANIFKVSESGQPTDRVFNVSTMIEKRGSAVTAYIETKIDCDASIISYGKTIYYDISRDQRKINDDGWSSFGIPKGEQDKTLVSSICVKFSN